MPHPLASPAAPSGSWVSMHNTHGPTHTQLTMPLESSESDAWCLHYRLARMYLEVVHVHSATNTREGYVTWPAAIHRHWQCYTLHSLTLVTHLVTLFNLAVNLGSDTLLTLLLFLVTFFTIVIIPLHGCPGESRQSLELKHCALTIFPLRGLLFLECQPLHACIYCI